MGMCFTDTVRCISRGMNCRFFNGQGVYDIAFPKDYLLQCTKFPTPSTRTASAAMKTGSICSGIFREITVCDTMVEDEQTVDLVDDCHVPGPERIDFCTKLIVMCFLQQFSQPGF